MRLVLFDLQVEEEEARWLTERLRPSTEKEERRWLTGRLRASRRRWRRGVAPVVFARARGGGEAEEKDAAKDKEEVGKRRRRTG